MEKKTKTYHFCVFYHLGINADIVQNHHFMLKVECITAIGALSLAYYM